jgi:polysaccharide biosynthesis/export protein
MRSRGLFTLIGSFIGISSALAAPVAPSDYRFAPGDTIEITVTPQRNFDRIVTVQPDGNISYVVVGQLQAAGLTVNQLAEKLREGLNRELVDTHR